MMRLKPLALALLTISIVALGGTQEGGYRRDPWRLLSTPRFKTLQGKVQVTVFLPEGSRSWTLDLWADENRSRVQFELPHPEGRSQITVFTMPDGVWVFLPFAKKALRHEGSGFPTWRDIWQIRTDKLEMAKNNYDLSVVGRDKIAGHFCLVLKMEPKFKGNAVRKIWVHPPTRLPLQVERYSPDGQLEIRVTLIEAKMNEPLPLLIFDPTIPPDWTVETVSFKRQQVGVEQASQVLGFDLLLPSWIPPGYALEGIFAFSEQRWKMAHIVYTDGVGVISVFQHIAPPARRTPMGSPPTPKPFGQPPSKPRHQGGLSPRGFPPIHRMFPQRVVVRDIGNLRVVLVSEVTRDWLERMANSMVPAAR
mgnify:CR=1 FL=1